MEVNNIVRHSFSHLVNKLYEIKLESNGMAFVRESIMAQIFLTKESFGLRNKVQKHIIVLVGFLFPFILVPLVSLDLTGSQT